MTATSFPLATLQLLPDEILCQIILEAGASTAIALQQTSKSLEEKCNCIWDHLFKQFLKTDFRHLPQENIDLIITKSTLTINATSYERYRAVLAWCLRDQSKEIKLLERRSQNNFQDSILRNLPQATTAQQKQYNTTLESLKLKLHTLKELQNPHNYAEACDIYKNREAKLDEMNHEAITILCSPMQNMIKWANQEKNIGYHIKLHGAITRVPVRMAQLINERCFLINPNREVEIDLSSNGMQWIPETLSEIKNLSKLDLTNNALQVIPKSITTLQSTLVQLDIGNQLKWIEGKWGFDYIEDNTGKRPMINQFEEFPSAVLALNNLTKLIVTKSSLKKFPPNLLHYLPKLWLLGITGLDKEAPLPPILKQQGLRHQGSNSDVVFLYK